MTLLLPLRLLRHPHPLPRRPTPSQLRPRSHFTLTRRVRSRLAPREIPCLCLRKKFGFEGFGRGGVGVEGCGVFAAFGGGVGGV